MGRNGIIFNFWEAAARTTTMVFLASGGWVLTMFVILHAWAIDLAAAQSPAPQPYRITAGDKIGVAVFGQPDLSGESEL